jgi:hypothetical protein
VVDKNRNIYELDNIEAFHDPPAYAQKYFLCPFPYDF